VALLGPHAPAPLPLEPLRRAGRPLRISRPRTRADDRLRAGAPDARHLGWPRLGVLGVCAARAVDPGIGPDRPLHLFTLLPGHSARLRRPLCRPALQDDPYP